MSVYLPTALGRPSDCNRRAPMSSATTRDSAWPRDGARADPCCPPSYPTTTVPPPPWGAGPSRHVGQGASLCDWDQRPERRPSSAVTPGWWLVDAHDVALAVPEPRRPAHTGQGRDLAVPLDPRHVVHLERDALGLEVAHFRLDVGDVPLRDRVPRLPGVGGAVDVERRAAGCPVGQGLPAELPRRREAQLVRVEVPRPPEVTRRNVRFDLAVTQHDWLPSEGGIPVTIARDASPGPDQQQWARASRPPGTWA